MIGARPTTYLKVGVLGDLRPVMVKCLGRLQKLYYSLEKDFFITSIRESTHGPGFDVIDEGSHVHVEFDPR